MRVFPRRPLANRGPVRTIMKTQRTFVSDAGDTARKVSFVRAMAEGFEDGRRIAQAISQDHSLIRGLNVVIRRLAKNEPAARILDKVFERYGTKYPREHRTYVESRLLH